MNNIPSQGSDSYHRQDYKHSGFSGPVQSNQQGGYTNSKRRVSQIQSKFDLKESSTKNEGFENQYLYQQYSNKDYGQPQVSRFDNYSSYGGGSMGGSYRKFDKFESKFDKYGESGRIGGFQTGGTGGNYKDYDRQGSYGMSQGSLGGHRTSYNDRDREDIKEDYQKEAKQIFNDQMDPLLKYNKIYQNENYRRFFIEFIMKNNPQLEQYQINPLVRVKMLINNESNNKQQQQQQKNNSDGDIDYQQKYHFEHDDLQRIFSLFGSIQKIIVKERGESYIQFVDFFSAYASQKALNNFVLGDSKMILSVQMCLENPEEANDEKLIGHFKHKQQNHQNNFIINIDKEEDYEELEQRCADFVYTNRFQIDIQDKDFLLKERIMGAQGANLYRLDFLSEKNATQREAKTDGELQIKLILDNINQTENTLLILTNNFSKYDCAIRYAHELLAQIVEEYKKYCERSNIEIKKDIHIKRIEKFNTELELIFKDDVFKDNTNSNKKSATKMEEEIK